MPRRKNFLLARVLSRGHSTKLTWAVLVAGLLGFLAGTSTAQFAPADRTPTPASAIVAGYAVGGRDAEVVARELQTRFAEQNGVRIAPDGRTNRVLVQAPADVHEQLRKEFPQPAASLNPLSQRAGRPDQATPDADEQSLTWAQRERTELTDRLQNISWRQLISAAQSMSTNRLILMPDDRSREMIATLPSSNGETTLRIDTQTGEFRLQGSPKLAKAWLDAIQALDQRGTSEATQLVPMHNVSAQSVNRAVNLLQSAQQNPHTAAARWSADVVGIAQQTPAPPEPLQVAQAQTQSAAPEAGNEAPADNPPAEPQPGQGGDEVGVDGSLIGPVQIEYVEGLDAIIIRGRKADVDRVMRIIDDIERLSEGTEPAIELIELQHVNSQSMAELVTQLNAEALAVRLGTVSITALIKPNALLLIGRPESVDATLELIRRLDQPVSPTSQFSIFRLKHLPATDAVQTISSFFEGRGGLGPLIQLQADFRTNSIIVYASPRDMEEVRQLLQEIDVADNAATAEVRVFKLNNALAEELAPALEATLRGQAAPTTGGPGAGPGQQAGGTTTGTSARSTTLTMTRIDTEGKQILKSGILTEVRVAADIRANSLVVTAPAESMDLIAALVHQLDELPTSEAEIKVFTIVNGDATTLAAMLDELFGIQQQGNQQGPATSATGAGESSLVPLRFSIDPRTNSIIATGATADLGVVEAILLRLDEDDISQRKSRIHRLQNAPALDVSNAINEFLRTERQITVELAPEAVSPFEQIEREVVVVPEVVSNSLIISATPRYFDQIVQLVLELDEQPPMVLIQVLIASVKLDNLCELGVELGLQDSLLFDRSVVSDVLTPGFNFNNAPLGNSPSTNSLRTRDQTAGQALSSFGVGRTNGDLGYGGLVLSASSESVNVLIRALQQADRLDILSRPQVMTLNNQPAFVQVGQQVPIVQNTSQTTFGQTNSVVLTNVGILLGVTPRISPQGLVVMEIDAEKSELSGDGVPISISANGEILRSPIIDTTRAQTTVSARSGQTVILGGLITKTRTTSSSSVPYLGDIPVLGNLFRFDSVSDERTELLIIMTPYIVRKEEDAELLNQIETQRMSWCLADVIDVHGDVGVVAGGASRSQVPAQVIYPDKTPTANELLPKANDEMPQAPVPNSRPGQLPDSSQLPSDLEPEATLPIRQPQHTSRQLNGEAAAENTTAVSRTRRLRDRLLGGQSRRKSTEANLQGTQDPNVSPVQYLNPRNEPSSWETDQRRLPTTK